MSQAANLRYEESVKGKETRARREARPERKAQKRATYLKNRAVHHTRVEQARSGGCVDCGARGDLDFHHLDPSTKDRNVVQMIGRSERAFLDEVGKCVVVCRSCHKARHGIT